MGGSRYVEGVLGFLVSWFLVSRFLVSWFRSFVVSRFLGYWFQYFKDLPTIPFHVFLIEIDPISKILLDGSMGFVGARLFGNGQHVGFPTF